nr:MAG TPA: Head fiber protein [Caudoviricetes sp.]
MAMTVKRRRDDNTPRVIVHRVADIRGGVSVDTKELGGDYLLEGTPLSAPENGVYHAIKIARVAGDVQSSETSVKIAKGHNFRVGDVVMADEANIATKITKIENTAKEYDTITIKVALGELKQGSFLVEAKEESTNESALKYKPVAISGQGVVIEPKSNLVVDAWVFAVTNGHPLPSCIRKSLTGVLNY